MALSLVCLLLAVPGRIDLQDARLPAGVRYAAERLREAADVEVSAQLGGEGLPAGLAAGGEEAFALEPHGDSVRVLATAHAGLMYGLLELSDRLQSADPPRKTTVSAPALRLRGDILDLPFYLGVDLYNGRWRWHEDIEGRADSWWLDRDHWAWRLQRCADLRLNALLLCHPHPFPALIDLPGGPQAAYFPPEHLRRLQDHFAWILEQAEQYGVRIYLLTWNIWVSPGFARGHDIAQEGADGAVVRAYTRQCYRRLFETYPQLAGVMTMAGEAPPGCLEFVRDAIVAGLNELERPPELLYWIWCSYPEDAQAVFDDYRGPATLVHYLQYEQLFRPQADPRIGRASRALGGVPVVTLGGLGTATGWLYWSDPYYLRDLLADLPRQNGVGCFFQGLDSFGWAAEKWLGWQALARYGWNPHRPREDGYWQARLARRYRAPEAAADLLRASIAASRIPTRLLALLHRQTDHFMPQFGLPLVHYLGLPTLSTYVFENHERIDEQGRLVPRLGLTWPNPDWGERVIGIVDFVAGDTRGTTPLDIARELEAAARVTLAAVERLRPFTDRVALDAAAWNRMLEQMAMNAHLGAHTAARIRAAVAWQRHQGRRQGEKGKRGSGADRAAAGRILQPLAESVAAMERMAASAAAVYPGMEIHTWRPGIGRPPPWTHLQIWTTDRYRRHGFADSAAMGRRELEWVRRELETDYPQLLLPFEDDLLPLPGPARPLLRWDFEGRPPAGLRLHHLPPHALALTGTGAAPAPLAGQRLVAEHRADGFWFPLTTDPAAFPLEIGKTYRTTLDYWILADAEHNGDWLSAGARTTQGGWQQDVGARYLGGPAGTRGRLTLTFTPHTWNDYYLYISLHGEATVEFDNLEIEVAEQQG